MRISRRLLLLALAAVFAVVAARAWAQIDYEGPPIHYDTQAPEDAVAQLAERLAASEEELAWSDDRGYLAALLDALAIPAESQVLVFSKTSFQADRISPSRPRALYFNDEVYIGWVQGSDVIEIAATDPVLGPVYYTLERDRQGAPIITHQQENCTQCHASSMTRGFPGHIVRSVVPGPAGQPILRAGTELVDHTTPLAKRWGGWYVTGTHGEQTHMGNTTASERDDPESFDPATGMNRTSLAGLLDTDPYLTPHSDIVALMVLEHQTFVHNQLTRAAYQARLAMYRQAEMNAMLEREEDHVSETTERLLENAAGRLVRALLLSGETRLTGPLTGTSGYAEWYSARGPRDGQGRGLYQLDLERRLYRYPCSPLIYSPSFEALPPELRERVLEQLLAVLTGEDRSEYFAHLSTEDRQTILDILRETMPDLPAS